MGHRALSVTVGVPLGPRWGTLRFLWVPLGPPRVAPKQDALSASCSRAVGASRESMLRFWGIFGVLKVPLGPRWDTLQFLGVPLGPSHGCPEARCTKCILLPGSFGCLQGCIWAPFLGHRAFSVTVGVPLGPCWDTLRFLGVLGPPRVASKQDALSASCSWVNCGASRDLKFSPSLGHRTLSVTVGVPLGPR